MDFPDNPSTPQVKDSLPKEHWRRNNGFSWQIPCGETSFQFRCRIVEHGITITQKENDFNHPYPMFTRVFLFRKGGAEIICRNQRRTLVENRIYILPANMVFQIHYYPRELIYYHLCLNDGYDQPIFDREETVQEIVSAPVREQLLRAHTSNFPHCLNIWIPIRLRWFPFPIWPDFTVSAIPRFPNAFPGKWESP